MVKTSIPSPKASYQLDDVLEVQMRRVMSAFIAADDKHRGRFAQIEAKIAPVEKTPGMRVAIAWLKDHPHAHATQAVEALGIGLSTAYRAARLIRDGKG